MEENDGRNRTARRFVPSRLCFKPRAYILQILKIEEWPAMVVSDPIPLWPRRTTTIAFSRGVNGSKIHTDT
jgi:hypothetical protein